MLRPATKGSHLVLASFIGGIRPSALLGLAAAGLLLLAVMGARLVRADALQGWDVGDIALLRDETRKHDRVGPLDALAARWAPGLGRLLGPRVRDELRRRHPGGIPSPRVRPLTDGGPEPLHLVVTVVALLVGPLLAWVGATNLRRERADQRRAVRLSGEVVGAEWRLVGGVGTEAAEPLSFPVVRYTEPTGSVRTFLADVGTGTVARQGTSVEVLHDPTGARPPQLGGLRSRAVLPSGFLALGAVVTLVGLGLLLALH